MIIFLLTGVSGTIWNRIRAELVDMAEIVDRSKNQDLLVSSCNWNTSNCHLERILSIYHLGHG